MVKQTNDNGTNFKNVLRNILAFTNSLIKYLLIYPSANIIRMLKSDQMENRNWDGKFWLCGKENFRQTGNKLEGNRTKFSGPGVMY